MRMTAAMVLVLPDVPERAWLAGLCMQNIGVEK